MDIDTIRAFVTVAELKSLSAAAFRMNHLQSNMTAKIKKIETHYEKQLFIRSSKGMELTHEGERLYAHYKKLLTLWEEAEQEMQQQDPKLRLGTMQSVIGSELTAAFTDLYDKYPRLSVTLKTGTTEEMEKALMSGSIDLAYTIGTSSKTEQLHFKKIGTEELVLIGKKAKSGVSLQHFLQGETMLVSSKECLCTAILLQLYSDLGLPAAPLTEVAVLETLLQFAALGMGIALLSKRIVRQFGLTDFVELPAEHRYVDKYLVTRQGYQLSPLERQFIEASHFL
ncbi:LysR family transcriptional regulator [Brevibacillus agri]|uniref:LysR family transcriptional regulator n=1 Tax=Brevibacillus agri TaxID=51101 RepID=UPI003D72E4C5